MDGIPVTYSYEILSHLQQRHVNIVVERDKKLAKVPTWQQADALFDQQYPWEDLQKLISRIGLSTTPQSIDNLVLLEPVVPKMRKDFQLSPESKTAQEDEQREQQHEIESIHDPEKQAQIRHLFRKSR